MQRRLALGALIVGVLLPLTSYASPFGGRVSVSLFCANGAIYALVGGPVGGAYIWVPSTKTYQFGPPTHSGQWVLGLSGIPYYCLVSILPLITTPGISIMMMGSSQ